MPYRDLVLAVIDCHLLAIAVSSENGSTLRAFCNLWSSALVLLHCSVDICSASASMLYSYTLMQLATAIPATMDGHCMTVNMYDPSVGCRTLFPSVAFNLKPMHVHVNAALPSQTGA